MSQGFISNILKTYRKNANLSVREVVDKLSDHQIRISEKTLYGWESGHRKPDADEFLVLCEIYGIDSIQGLSCLTPERFIKASTQTNPNDKETALLKSFNELNDAGQALIVDYADTLVMSGKYAIKEKTPSAG